MKKVLDFLLTAMVVVSLGVPLVAMVALAILAPTAHTVIVALIALLVCGIAFLIYRNVSAGRPERRIDKSEA